MSDIRLTHMGGPTLLIEVEGWRLLTDPTFDPAGGTYPFLPTIKLVKLAGPAVAARDLLPIDAVLLSHDEHDDNLDLAGRELLPDVGVVITTTSGAGRLGARHAASTRGRRPGSRRRAGRRSR